MNRKQFKLKEPKKKLWCLFDNPFTELFPEHANCCSPADVERLHLFYCKELGIEHILPKLKWHFERRFSATLGQAEYWNDENTGEMRYLIRYATKPWVPMGPVSRKNLIAHEVCHLAVECLFGHGSVLNGIKVTDHGYHWKLLMAKCGEDPDHDTGC